MHTAVRVSVLGSLLTGCWAAPAPAEQASEQTVEQAPTPAEIVVKPSVEPVVEPTPPPPATPAACKVEQLYAGIRPHSLAVDATHVYFVEDSKLFRLPRTGGQAELLVSHVESMPPVLVDGGLIVCRRDARYDVTLLLVDAEGKISGEVYSPDERLDRFSIGYLVDVDGDGVDEVLFNSSYYEGSYEHLLEWDDGHPTRTTLAGDGA